MLLKWSALLALGWMSHWLLRRQHPGWRLFLWRGILCASLLVPIMQFAPVPVLDIPIYPSAISPGSVPDISPSTTARPPLLLNASRASSLAPTAGIHPVASAASSAASQAISLNILWKTVLPSIWAFGVILAGFRLVRFQIQLGRLRRLSRPANSDLCQRMQAIQARLGVRQIIAVRVSHAISSPFACGLWRPMILLPEKFVQELPAVEISALLAHEVAHHRRHDLFWCIGWRWMQAIFWFHPLVWNIPSAHNLACEQEADRVASSQLEDRSVYPQMLARLTLRVLALPAVETQLALNGTSQIARRLHHLKNGKTGGWRLKHSLAATALAGLLFLLTNGCNFSHSSPTNFPANTEFKKVMMIVEDENGKPIEGAAIKPFGFRVQGVRHVDANGWNPKQFGPAATIFTDHEGKAWMRYPVVAIPEEKLLTAEISCLVSFPGYCSVDIQGFPVDGTGKPFHLAKGIVLEVTGYYGPDHKPVTELIPNLGEGQTGMADWNKDGSGVYSYQKLDRGDHLIWLMGRLATGEIVYSDSQEFMAEPGKTNSLNLKMNPGIRIEGRLDDTVTRPVKNGRVLIDVRPRQIPAYRVPEDWSETKFANFRTWQTYRPIAEDGTFVFESVPPGEVDVIVLGDGFVSKSIGKIQNRVNGQLANGPNFGIPQPFPLQAPLTKIEVITEPTATLDLIAKTKTGKPIKGATVWLNPNVYRMGGIFGVMAHSSEAPYRDLPPLPHPPYQAETDSNGEVIMKNIPALGHGLNITHPEYEIPLEDIHNLPNRRVPIDLAPGATNFVTVVMEPVGKDFIGTAK